MSHHDDDRGMATAEYTIGTLGAVLIAAALFRLGLLDDGNPWLDSFRKILDQALGWGRLHGLFDTIPGIGIRVG